MDVTEKFFPMINNLYIRVENQEYVDLLSELQWKIENGYIKIIDNSSDNVTNVKGA